MAVSSFSQPRTTEHDLFNMFAVNMSSGIKRPQQVYQHTELCGAVTHWREEIGSREGPGQAREVGPCEPHELNKGKSCPWTGAIPSTDTGRGRLEVALSSSPFAGVN